MKNRLSLIIITFVSVFILLFSVVYGFDIKYDVRFYQTFRYSNNSDNSKAIVFLNRISKKQAIKSWHVKVYFDNTGNWVKFDNYNKNGNKLQTISNTILVKLKHHSDAITYK